MSRCWQLMGCRDGLCEENTGDVLCQTLPAPTDPPRDTAEPFSLVMIWVIMFKKEKKMHSSEENKTVNTKLREFGEKMLQDLEQVFPRSPWKREHQRR